MLVSGKSRAGCGGIPTVLGDDELLSFVVESLGFEEMLVIEVAPVVAPCATLAESLVHTGLGLGPVLDDGTGRERTFGAGHDGRRGGGRQAQLAGVYIGGINGLVTSCGSTVSAGPSHINNKIPGRPCALCPFFDPLKVSLSFDHLFHLGGEMRGK